MTTRRPRRSRRRTTVASTLPRPGVGDSDAPPGVGRVSERATAASSSRVHHVTTDYGYVKTDLVTIAVVGAVVIGFIVAVSYLL